jgi:hypothetical protein
MAQDKNAYFALNDQFKSLTGNQPVGTKLNFAATLLRGAIFEMEERGESCEADFREVANSLKLLVAARKDAQAAAWLARKAD